MDSLLSSEPVVAMVDPSTSAMTMKVSNSQNQHRRAMTAPADFFLAAAAVAAGIPPVLVVEEQVMAATATIATEEEQAAAAAAALLQQPEMLTALTVLPAVVATVATAAVAVRQPESLVTSLLQEHAVVLNDAFSTDNLRQLDHLINVFSNAAAASDALTNETALESCTPGFFLNNSPTINHAWKLASHMPQYQTLALSNTLPLPEARLFLQCFQYISKVWSTYYHDSSSCSCFQEWDFCLSDNTNKHKQASSIAKTMVNLSLEQLMIQEATHVLNQTDNLVSTFNSNYYYNDASSNDSTSTFSTIIHPDTRIRLLRNRDDYAQVVVQCCLAARSTIFLNTCYLFGHDAFVHYLFTTLLPHCIRQHGVQVQIMVDLMTVEGAMVSSAFSLEQSATTGGGSKKQVAANTEGITPTSFVQRLDENAPPYDSSRRLPASMMEFLQDLLSLAESLNHHHHHDKNKNMEIRWWCARDVAQGYRIKNHTKGIVVDGQVAIMGGSNVCPTMAAATTEIDMLVAGTVVAQDVHRSFLEMWHSLEPTTSATSFVPAASSNPVEDACSPAMQQVLANQAWSTSINTDGSDSTCDSFFLRSTPSSEGDDIILRAVLDAINKAQTSIHMCFGHSNFVEPVCQALKVATEERNVTVKLMVNSMYSCDLRGGQQDLFRSIQRLLQVAPKVEVYSTALNQKNGQKPPFIHAKYVTIDGHWTAVGSWNMWHRAAYFEVENELIMPNSLQVAQGMVQKFEDDQASSCVRVANPESCCQFLPSGCMLCQGFGPFYPGQ